MQKNSWIERSKLGKVNKEKDEQNEADAIPPGYEQSGDLCTLRNCEELQNSDGSHKNLGLSKNSKEIPCQVLPLSYHSATRLPPVKSNLCRASHPLCNVENIREHPINEFADQDPDATAFKTNPSNQKKVAFAGNQVINDNSGSGGDDDDAITKTNQSNERVSDVLHVSYCEEPTERSQRDFSVEENMGLPKISSHHSKQNQEKDATKAPNLLLSKIESGPLQNQRKSALSERTLHRYDPLSNDTCKNVSCDHDPLSCDGHDPLSCDRHHLALSDKEVLTNCSDIRSEKLPTLFPSIASHRKEADKEEFSSVATADNIEQV